MKNLWKKPELVVLVRGKPEENVLQVCKGDGSTTSNKGKVSGCHIDTPCGNPCDTITAT